MKIIVALTIELPVEVIDDPDCDIDFWLEGSSLCLNSLLPPNEYHQCICPLVTDKNWRMPTVEDTWHFDSNPLWTKGIKPKEGIDC